MCRRASLALTPERQSPARARAWVAEVCASWELEDLCDDVTLATSEIVTNAVLHARTPVLLEMCLVDDVIDVKVRDLSPQLPTVLPVRKDLVSDIDELLASDGVEDEDLRHASWVVGSSGSVAAGRGLHLLEAITDSWGVNLMPDRNGKVVWFSLGVPEGWETDYPCRRSQERSLSAAR